MGVNLGGGDVFVAQKFLDGSDIYSFEKEVGGKAVP